MQQATPRREGDVDAALWTSAHVPKRMSDQANSVKTPVLLDCCSVQMGLCLLWVRKESMSVSRLVFTTFGMGIFGKLSSQVVTCLFKTNSSWTFSSSAEKMVVFHTASSFPSVNMPLHFLHCINYQPMWHLNDDGNININVHFASRRRSHDLTTRKPRITRLQPPTPWPRAHNFHLTAACDVKDLYDL